MNIVFGQRIFSNAITHSMQVRVRNFFMPLFSAMIEAVVLRWKDRHLGRGTEQSKKCSVTVISESDLRATNYQFSQEMKIVCVIVMHVCLIFPPALFLLSKERIIFETQ
eukprot:scpid77527/ scgid12328/ 